MSEIDDRIEKISGTPQHEMSEFHFAEIARLRRLKESRLKDSAMVRVDMTRAEAQAFLSRDFEYAERYVEKALGALRDICKIAQRDSHAYGIDDRIKAIKIIAVSALEEQ